ncbi:alcohol dehydrogenase family protein [Pseudonocardia kongjuensis]|uniref:Alcohol dehydrogenase family protein n=1 Tax=Pseudonocardia kongjuensis TaxID=102227 RepID=A0ABP4I764_9PSEU
MKGLVYRGPADVEVREVPDPGPPDDDGAVVRVSAAGICGSDLHIYRGDAFSADTGFCLGHEAVGRVTAVGCRVREVAVGDRVLVPASVGCTSCPPCRTGWVTRCERRTGTLDTFYGLHAGLPGSQAELLAVPYADANLVLLPDGISDAAAVVLTDNAPTAWYGARRAGIRPGETVAVIGLGAVGLMAVQSALVMGAARVLALDPLPERRRRAADLGAVPLTGSPDPKSELRAATGGHGPDVVIEAVGADATIDLAIRAVRHAGRVSIVGVTHNRAFPMHLQLVQVKELDLAIGLASMQREIPALLALCAQGRLSPEQVVTHHLPLADGSVAYRRYAARADGIGKIILHPGR